uniref:Uncharacterized protein n=1 Tax=Candidatus Kentrum sp. MB TaxID=2138164 RepID=A0A451BGY3_9GAMM|nr:MAG: hypothetical protein BECKMB1821I_GA0114274_10252 [Candidatus Kentron sp. MB]VFK32675.1 MAG: hypothetical protein BECKMB1821G_GA0114241_11205 [Candidatus Kentron sp. MB]VFK77528.1 MAG: hypothetical protein BECKMB1821H_GA0114242_11555 [Candidatus Kentron sp. MB]
MSGELIMFSQLKEQAGVEAVESPLWFGIPHDDIIVSLLIVIDYARNRTQQSMILLARSKTLIRLTRRQLKTRYQG